MQMEFKKREHMSLLRGKTRPEKPVHLAYPE